MDSVLQQFLIGYSVNLSTDAIKILVQKVKDYVRGNPDASKSDIAKEIEPSLHVHDANIVAEGMINFLIEKGELIVEGSKIFSKDSIKIEAEKFTIGDKTISATPKSVIDLGKGAYVKGVEAGIEQDKDGNIIFTTKT